MRRLRCFRLSEAGLVSVRWRFFTLFLMVFLTPPLGAMTTSASAFFGIGLEPTSYEKHIGRYEEIWLRRTSKPKSNGIHSWSPSSKSLSSSKCFVNSAFHALASQKQRVELAVRAEIVRWHAFGLRRDAMPSKTSRGHRFLIVSSPV